METSFFTSVSHLYFHEPHASLLNGIILGEPLSHFSEFYEQLKIVGLVHIVVLSGSNISLLISTVCISTERLGKFVSTLLTIAVIIVFILFVGPDPPIVRSGFNGILSLIAILFGRKTFALYSLILSAIVLLIFNPEWITSISFQLSYAASLGIILFAKSVENQKDEKNTLRVIKMYLLEELRITLSAQLFTIPIIWLYFQQISFVSPITNILISWTIAPIMIFGIITLMLGKVHYVLGFIPSTICYGLLEYIIVITRIFSKIPFASFSL